MRLELDRIDLLSEHDKLACRKVRIEHFRPTVQAAVTAVGHAVFYEFDRQSYTGVSPKRKAPAT